MVSTSEFELIDQEEGGDGTSRKSRFCGLTKRVLIIGGGVALVCLALGLGLGLGLSNDGDDGGKEEMKGCQEFDVSSQRQHRRASRSGTWDPDGPCPDPDSCSAGYQPIILISLDGFRAEYLTRGLTPTLRRLSECGAHAPYMRASYPTKTFPNHYTLVTGLHPESHGIVDNNMYDREWKERFSLGTDAKFDGKWYEGDPFWLTAQDGGKRSAAMFWPGSDADIKDRYPDYCFTYNGKVEYEDRIEQVLQWVELPENQRPDFITLYFEEPDATGHDDGPWSEEVDESLKHMDGIIRDLMDGLAELNLDKCANVIILADHGMSHIECSQRVRLDQHLDTSKYYFYTGQNGRISSQYIRNDDGDIVENPNPETPDEILSHLACTDYNTTREWYLKFYKKEEAPRRLHYSRHHRIDEVIIDVAEEWVVTESNSGGCNGGDHGADNDFASMHAIFVAHGPAFKQGVVMDPFDNIEVYNLMADILNVSPSPNNGTLGSLQYILNQPNIDVTPPTPEGKYEGCTFPDANTAEKRRNATDCPCDDWKLLTNKTIEEIDSRFDLTEEERETLTKKHLPLGVPNILSDTELCMLVQEDYISAFSEELHMPAYTAFSLMHEGDSVLDGNTRSQQQRYCSRVDVRVSAPPACVYGNMADENLVQANLYPYGLSREEEAQLDALVASNHVPMYRGFREGIWQEVLWLLEEYAEKYQGVHVMLGPVWDHDGDGHADSRSSASMSVPSHYFVVVSHCTNPDNPEACANTLQSTAMVINHKPALDNCWERYQFPYLQDTVVRLRDVELLTGLSLLTDVAIERRMRLLTHLQVGLLERLGWGQEETCPSLSDTPKCPEGYDPAHPPLLLISLDGFRPDYLQRNHTATLSKLHECGVKADYMRSQYPSHTFPNHYTIVTGKYPEVHGIIDNNMYDQDFDEYFCLSCDTRPEWWEAEPLWNTLVKNNHSAMTFFWPGSDTPIQGMYPTEWYPYDGSVPYEYRVDQTLKWLRGETAGGIPSLVILYLSKVDSAGHEGGPDSIELTEALETVEKSLKDLMDGLHRSRLDQCVNVVITSDHGMSTISCDRSVLLADSLNEYAMSNSYTFPGTAGRVSNQYTRNSDGSYRQIPEEEQVPVEEMVKNTTCSNPNMETFDKADLPKRLHYASHPRIDSVIAKMADTWQVDRFSPWCGIKGQHGFDPYYETMKAFFVGYGPQLKQETTVPPFANIELYNVMSHLVGVDPLPNNGTAGSLNSLLVSPPSVPPVENIGEYLVPGYPGDEDEYQRRANLTSAGCSCSPPNQDQDIADYDNALNLSDAEKDALMALHVPHGPPALLDAELTLYTLHHSAGVVSGYLSSMHTPLWAAFTLNNTQEISDIPECLRPDVRMNQSEQASCMDQSETMQLSPLYPPAWSSSANASMDLLTLSNTVSMYRTFYDGVWRRLLEYIKSAADTEALNAVLGPVWDNNADGRRDHNVTSSDKASHFYAVLMRCADDTCSKLKGSPLSFILPHKADISNCVTFQDYLLDHRARIRDVELLTDLQFFTASPPSADTVVIRTHHPEELW